MWSSDFMRNVAVVVVVAGIIGGCSDLQPRSEEIGVAEGKMFSQTTGDCLDGSYEGTVDAEMNAVTGKFIADGFFSLDRPAYLTVPGGQVTVSGMEAKWKVEQMAEIRWNGILLWTGGVDEILFLEGGDYELRLITWVKFEVSDRFLGHYRLNVWDQRGVSYKYK